MKSFTFNNEFTYTEEEIMELCWDKETYLGDNYLEETNDCELCIASDEPNVYEYTTETDDGHSIIVRTGDNGDDTVVIFDDSDETTVEYHNSEYADEDVEGSEAISIFCDLVDIDETETFCFDYENLAKNFVNNWESARYFLDNGNGWDWELYMHLEGVDKDDEDDAFDDGLVEINHEDAIKRIADAAENGRMYALHICS